MKEDKYECSAQQRILKVVESLVGNEVFGLTALELSRKMGISNISLFRDLQNLQLAGWAEQFEDGKWRLSVNAAKMLRQINDGMMGAINKVNDARTSYQGAML